MQHSNPHSDTVWREAEKCHSQSWLFPFRDFFFRAIIVFTGKYTINSFRQTLLPPASRRSDFSASAFKCITMRCSELRSKDFMRGSGKTQTEILPTQVVKKVPTNLSCADRVLDAVRCCCGKTQPGPGQNSEWQGILASSHFVTSSLPKTTSLCPTKEQYTQHLTNLKPQRLHSQKSPSIRKESIQFLFVNIITISLQNHRCRSAKHARVCKS